MGLGCDQLPRRLLHVPASATTHHEGTRHHGALSWPSRTETLSFITDILVCQWNCLFLAVFFGQFVEQAAMHHLKIWPPPKFHNMFGKIPMTMSLPVLWNSHPALFSSASCKAVEHSHLLQGVSDNEAWQDATRHPPRIFASYSRSEILANASSLPCLQGQWLDYCVLHRLMAVFTSLMKRYVAIQNYALPFPAVKNFDRAPLFLNT